MQQVQRKEVEQVKKVQVKKAGIEAATAKPTCSAFSATHHVNEKQ